MRALRFGVWLALGLAAAVLGRKLAIPVGLVFGAYFLQGVTVDGYRGYEAGPLVLWNVLPVVLAVVVLWFSRRLLR